MLDMYRCNLPWLLSISFGAVTVGCSYSRTDAPCFLSCENFCAAELSCRSRHASCLLLLDRSRSRAQATSQPFGISSAGEPMSSWSLSQSPTEQMPSSPHISRGALLEPPCEPRRFISWRVRAATAVLSSQFEDTERWNCRTEVDVRCLKAEPN